MVVCNVFLSSAGAVCVWRVSEAAGVCVSVSASAVCVCVCIVLLFTIFVFGDS